jgi:cyclin T
MASNNEERWYFTKEQLENSPSRRCGMDADKELSHRQQAANFIQDMGQRLQVTQLCINTAIVYMHRFYCFHSFTHFHRNAIASAALFLAAKVEEQPRKLEHIIKVAQMCLQKTNQTPLDRRSEVYLEQAQELVMNENILLMTLGFDVAIEHPHAFIVKFCHIANASKDLSQTSYFMASNSLHLTTMCLQYKPTVVACFCIHLSCQWSRWQIPKSKENLPWYSYIDQSVTEELLEQLTNEFLVIFDKCPSRLKKKIQNCQGGQNSMSGYIFDADRKHISSNNQHAPSSSSSSTKPIASTSSSVVNGSRMHPSSNVHDNVANKLPSANNAVIPPQMVKSSFSHAPPSSSSGGSSQPHPYKSSNPHGAVPSSSAIKPHPFWPGPSNSSSNHSSGSAFTKDANQRAEQAKKTAMDIKHKPGPFSALPPVVSAVNNNHHPIKPNVSTESVHRKESVPPPPVPHTTSEILPPPSRTSFAPSHSDIISNVVKEVALANKADNKQRLNSTVKNEPMVEDVKPLLECLNAPKTSKNHSIFSPSPVGNDDGMKSSPFEDRMVDTLGVKMESLSPEKEKTQTRNRNLSSSSGERELIPIVKKVDDVAGYEDIFNKDVVSVSGFKESPKPECSRDDRNSTNDLSHSHKKKKKHKKKDEKHDKEKHRHKEKKKHKDDKHKKDHKEKKASKEHEPCSSADPIQERIPERIKITIPKEKLMDIPAKPREKERSLDGPVKLKINLNNQVVTPAVSDVEDGARSSEFKLKISKDKMKARKRHRNSEPEELPKKFSYNGADGFNNGY